MNRTRSITAGWRWGPSILALAATLFVASCSDPTTASRDATIANNPGPVQPNAAAQDAWDASGLNNNVNILGA
jgi:hypothetical protein